MNCDLAISRPRNDSKAGNYCRAVALKIKVLNEFFVAVKKVGRETNIY